MICLGFLSCPKYLEAALYSFVEVKKSALTAYADGL